MGDDVLIDMVRKTADAYASGVAEGERRAEARAAAAEARVAELEEALRLLQPMRAAS